VRRRVRDQLLPFPNEERQIAELAVFHDEIDMAGRFDAVVEGNNVRMPKSLEDGDLAVQVFLEFLAQAPELDRLDGDKSTCGL